MFRKRREKMFGTERWSRVFWNIRAAGVLAVFLIALAGAPDLATARQECETYVIDCTTAEACVEDGNEWCPMAGECEGIIKCDPGIYWGCEESQYPVAQICKEDDPA